MRLIISPAKKMVVNTDALECRNKPVLLDKAQELCRWIRGMSFEEQKRLWKCSDAIAERSAAEFEVMESMGMMMAMNRAEERGSEEG